MQICVLPKENPESNDKKKIAVLSAENAEHAVTCSDEHIYLEKFRQNFSHNTYCYIVTLQAVFILH